MSRVGVTAPVLAALLCCTPLYAQPTESSIKHRIFVAGWASRGPAILGEDFEEEWYLADKRELSDAWVLADGGIVFSFSRRTDKKKKLAESGVIRLDKNKKVLWTYTAPNNRDNHTCQPLPNGGFLLGESAPDGLWLVEIDRNGKEYKRLKVGSACRDPFHAVRTVRKTAEGTYLAVVMGGASTKTMQAATYEWDSEGKVIRKFPGGFYVAVRTPEGTTIVTGHAKPGRRGFVVEYDKRGKTVWELTVEDVEKMGIQMCLPCGVQRLPNGNTVITNVKHGKQHGRKDGTSPKAIEVTRDKKLVWMVPKSAGRGNMGSLQVLDVPGDPAKFEVTR